MNSVLPSVFQGNYNAVSRHIEKDLFPLLRKLGIAFYAYSPIAGGFLVKSAKEIREGSSETGRFKTGNALGDMYRTLYGKESLINALDDWGEIPIPKNNFPEYDLLITKITSQKP